MKIVPKLTCALVGGMCIVLVVNASLRVWRETRTLERGRRARDELVARCVAASFAAVWRTTGERAAEAELHFTTQEVDGLTARWVPASSTEPRHVDLSVLAQAPVGVPIVVPAEGDAPWHTYVPIDIGEERRGAVEIVDTGPGSTTNAETIVRESSLTALALGIASALIAFLLNHWLIGRPVRSLSERARAIARGQLHGRAAVTSKDELGELAREINAMSARLVTTLDQLRHADRLATLGKVAAGLAHELGTPLNIVSARAEMIAGGRVSHDETRAYANVITAAVERMTNLVRQLLQFARRSPAARAPADLAAMTRAAVELLRPFAVKRDLEMVVDVQALAPLDADAGQLQQVVTNLVMNAIQASSPGGDIRVRVSERVEAPPVDVEGQDEPTTCVCIDVIDRGSGIAESDMPSLFEPFFTTKDVGEGTGLGLAVSYGIVREHGGWIRVESKVGEGAHFAICIPKKDAA